METGSNNSLYTLIAVVVFGIFLALSHSLFQVDNLKGYISIVTDGVEENMGFKFG